MPICRRIVIIWLVLLCTSVGEAAERQVLKGHVPAATSNLAAVDRLPAKRHLRMAINLPLRNRDALDALLQQLYDPASPSFHHFLTSEEFTAAFGPTKEDYDAVIEFARSRGLTVTSTRANRALVEVEGPVANIEKAFHVNLRVYPHPTERRNFFAPDVEPSIDLKVPVLAIAGLSNYKLPHPAALHTRKLGNHSNVTPNVGAASGGLYIGQDFRSAYAQGVTNTGAGQAVGLLEFDSYYAADISSYLSTPQASLGNPSVTLSNIVFPGLTGPPGSANSEVALDIEMAISMAPGLSTIYVYEATNNSTEADVILSRMASDNLAKQLSSSWTGFDDAGVQQAFIEFAIQGQSFFQASGDSGEYSSHKNPVEPPADSTNITSVGGTTLSTSGPRGSWTSETTWSWFTQPLDGLTDNATSGGISPTYLQPPWQSGLSTPANQGSSFFRNLPDVSMVANQIFLIADNGTTYFAGGTSAAAPLWAGLTALINQQRAVQGQPPEGFLNPALYSIGKGANYASCFHDITVGNNTNLSSSKQFFATTGYDLCTGWGTPIGSALISALAPEPLQITPSGGFASSGPYGGPFTAINSTFLLTNAATSSFNWTAGGSSPWLSASPASGTLVSGGAAAAVSLSLNSAASSLQVGSYTNTLTFTNLSDGGTQSFQVTLTVSQAAPVVTWSSPGPISYGTTLSGGQLNATANVPGGFAYFPANGTVLNTEGATLSAIFTPNDTVDYSSATNTVTLVVSPAALTVTAANANRPFGQANPAFTGTVTGITNGDDITVAYSCGATTNSSTGTYPIIPALLDPNNRQTNYTVSLVDGTLTVEPLTLGVTWTDPATITYGTALTSNELNATANVAGSFNYFPTNGTVLDTGTNTLCAVFTPSDTVDYSGATNKVTLVVSPAPLTVTADSQSRIYGQANPAFTGTLTGVTNADNITAIYSCSATTNSTAGTYSIIPTLADPNNRQTNYIVSLASGVLTVAPAVATITWANPASITYGTCTTSNQLNATASVPGSFAYTPTNGTMLTAGTNVLSVVFTPADSVDFSPATATVSLVVAPAQLTVTAANASRAFGQENPPFMGAITGLTNGDNITATYSCSADTNSPVGTYSIIPTLVDPENSETNYIVNLADGTLTVGQTIENVAWTNPSAISYGAALTAGQLNATATVPGSFTYVPTNGAVLNAGTNTLCVHFTPADTLDYISATNTVTLVVLPAPLTVTAASASRIYGQGNPAFIGAISGVTNGDSITALYSCSATTNSTVGAYAITPSLLDPSGRQTNYTVNLIDGTLTVVQAAPSIIWTNPPPIGYGAAVSSGQLNATADVPGSFSYSPSNGVVLNAGTNTLFVLFTPADAIDYSGVSNTVSLVVSPATLTVTAFNASRAYGEANPAFTGAISGMTNGDDITASFICNATTNSPAGIYSITPTLLDPNDRQTNYAVTVVDGTLTVGQAASSITWGNPAPIIYGVSLSSNQLNAAASVPGSFSYSPSNGVVLNAGTNTLFVLFTPADAIDYSGVSNTVNLVVFPATLTVTAFNASRAYGEANPAFTGAISGVTNGDDIMASFICNATTNSPAGIYSITPALLDPSDRQTNYTVTIVDGTLTVGQAASLINWDNPGPIVYGVSLSSNELNATASVPGSFSYSPTNGATLNAGTNTLFVRFTPADTIDYSGVSNTISLVVFPATLTVTAFNASRAYGEANPAFTGAISGVTNGDDITASYICNATTNSPAGIYSITPALLDPNDRQTNYAVTVVDGTLTVGQAASLVTWDNPGPIVYGVSLGSNQLNAAASVPGSFSYSPTNGATLNAGTNTLFVRFTPADAIDYSGASNTVSLVVSPATLTVTAFNASRTFGQTNPVFGGAISGLTNGDDITASFSCGADASSPAGTYAIVPSLVDPSDRQTNYVVSLVDGTLTVVGQSVPSITWTAPAPIIYGTALSSNQLNANATVPGTFSYAPANGALLNAGTNSVSVLFTPADTVDYISASNIVSVVVSPATVTIASGVTANSKIYDGTTTATLSFSSVALSGVLGEDSVTLNTNGYAANFAIADAGHGIAVTVSGLTLMGANAGNYSLAQPENLTASISSPNLQIAPSSRSIVISWPTNASAYVLEQTKSLAPPVTWTAVTTGITINGGNNTAVIDASSGTEFFELIATPQ